MNDISEILRSLLDEYSNPATVDAEFAKMLIEDNQLNSDYRDWCEGNGYDLKSGYQDYVDELMESRDSIWDELNE